MSAVSRVLGRHKRDAPDYGDVVLHRGGLGVFLDYAIFTVDHPSGMVARIAVPDDTIIAWAVDHGC